MAATIINNPPGIIDGPARIYASNVYTLHVDTDRSTIVSKAIISPSPGRAPFEPFHRRPTTFLLVHRGRITKPYLSIRDAFFFRPPLPLLSRHVIIGYGSEISIGNIFAGLFFFFSFFIRIFSSLFDDGKLSWKNSRKIEIVANRRGEG